MALAQTDLPELRRFHFFVSRRFEEGRERFRLHMGYFATLAEAEEWLGVVREIYPGAWAGETPGRKLRERAAAAAAAQAQHAAGPQTQLASAPAPAAGTAPAQRPASPPLVTAPAPTRVPVVHAAPAPARGAPPTLSPASAATSAPGVTVPTGRPASGPPAIAARLAAAMRATAPPRAAGKTVLPAASRAAVPPATPPAAARATPVAPAPPRATPPSAPSSPPIGASSSAPSAAATATPKVAKSGVKPVFEDSNVREVLKALGDASATGETRLMRAPPPLPLRESAPGAPSLSDTQVLKMLETRRSEESNARPSEVDDGGIPLLKPDDTGTRQALKEAVVSNSAVAFAVQLQWSVQPVELDKVPPLAIFSAYTLYTVEGSRDGRRWYGLRLGFFSDAISAKQVAYYVRSEFSSVAVVPVSPQEKGRATDQDAAAALAAPAPVRTDPMDEFKLIDDEPPKLPAVPPAKPAVPPARATAAKGGPAAPKVAVGRTVVQPAAAQPKARVRARVAARDSRGPQTLEETLEILGASQLSIDDGRGETLNDSGVRHLRVEVQKNSPFSKLLERLSERLKKS
ncbi:MAG: hypothetical protein JO158_01220 [Gammaproteobacteria bacterium]|nr:hypothetical protein [Gammaproteobacteria bacterium]